MLFECIDLPLLGFIWKVAFCCKYKYAPFFKELAHCVLRDISSDLNGRTNYVRPRACVCRYGEPSSSQVELQNSHDYGGDRYGGDTHWKGCRPPIPASFPFELGWSGWIESLRDSCACPSADILATSQTAVIEATSVTCSNMPGWTYSANEWAWGQQAPFHPPWLFCNLRFSADGSAVTNPSYQTWVCIVSQQRRGIKVKTQLRFGDG